MKTYDDPISVVEAARRADVTHAAVYNWINFGHFEAQKIAGHWILDGDDVDRFLAERAARQDDQGAA